MLHLMNIADEICFQPAVQFMEINVRFLKVFKADGGNGFIHLAGGQQSYIQVARCT